MSSTVLRLAPPGRSIGIDAARGIALFGMIATHVMPLSGAAGDPVFPAVIAGRAAALFAVLAGVSTVLSTRRVLEAPGARGWTAAAAGLGVRGVFIALIGLLLGSLPSGIAIILVNYGAMFVLAVPLLRAPTWLLGVLAPVWLAAAPVLSFAIRRAWGLSPAYDVPSLATAVDLPRLAQALVLTGYYPVLQWMGYVVLGMFVARLDWHSVRRALGLAAAGGACAVLALSASSLLLSAGGRTALEIATAQRPDALRQALGETSYGITPTDTWWWLTIAGPHSGTPFDMVSTAGIAVAVLGGCGAAALAIEQRWGRTGLAWCAPLSAPGSMPLSIYTAHVVLVSLTADLFCPARALGDGAEFALHACLFVLAAVVWKALIGARGPLEAVVSASVRGASRFALTR
ncbi:DUF1624 domain-containing protein [Brevibacterium sp. 5221]|uniref:DUF1624 domain-containing protein n=1 Tax=Brevibacterium rongguiense TaxID=2695267 RepID=A0A6N9H821_9MICO|nr:heparan-alpha-glucosaminide N-acetyltransferase domain-containing protein [Brevibacterium rongguiense]MYM20031.1 DUF1624 domain-containing protein [Brevibacterium rongguiense]